MDAKNILVVGLNGSLRGYRRDTGVVLWSTHLQKKGFVSFVADEHRVYAHTNGELFCVDLLTGNPVWNDPLKGWGFDVATLALPGVPMGAASATTFEKMRQEQAAAAAATTSSAATSSSSHG